MATPDIWQVRAQELLNQGYFIADSFFDKTVDLRNELETFKEQGLLKKAGTGTKAEQSENIRTDHILWWQTPYTPVQEDWFAKITELKSELNAKLMLGLFNEELHYASYEPGGHYEKHVDRFQDSPQGGDRILSLVFYLNRKWQTEDAGELVFYKSEDSNIVLTTVSPIEGRLVCFLSDLLYHEVKSPRRTRLSVTGWLRNRRIDGRAKSDF